jgi:hypothetical protein
MNNNNLKNTDSLNLYDDVISANGRMSKQQVAFEKEILPAQIKYKSDIKENPEKALNAHFELGKVISKMSDSNKSKSFMIKAHSWQRNKLIEDGVLVKKSDVVPRRETKKFKKKDLSFIGDGDITFNKKKLFYGVAIGVAVGVGIYFYLKLRKKDGGKGNE